MENRIVLITGTSTGIGRATVNYFVDKGWKVAATLCKKEDFFFSGEESSARHFLLDVSQEIQCKKVVEDVIETTRLIPNQFFCQLQHRPAHCAGRNP